MAIEIRLAASADLPVVTAIVERAYAGYVGRIGRRPAPMDDDYVARHVRAELFVAAQDAVVGLIVLIQQTDHLLIENVAVDPARQGTGVGRALLAFAEACARERGLLELRLYTNAAMTENLILYQRIGYCETDRRGHDGFERVFFVKRLP
jgi:ribosomal protein S18 acetylase RimI-like enzyme